MPVAPLLVSDLAQVVAIETQVYPDPWLPQMFASIWQSEHVHAVKVVRAGELAGYLIYGQVVPDVEIMNIAVAPTFQRQGVAQELLQWLCADVKTHGCESIFLEVRTSNVAAQALYQRHGFETIGTRPQYYANGEDALIMALSLVAT